jgi:sugar phosphate isomerase/epimerase
MRLGISSYTYAWAVGVPGYPVPHRMESTNLLGKAATLGVSVVQFADNMPLDQLLPSKLISLRQRATELGITIEVGARGIAPDYLRTYLRLATQLQSSILRVVVDTAQHHPSDDEVVETAGSLMPEFEQAGVYLAIENHDRFTTRSLVRILERIGSSHAGICLDTANSLGALEGPDAVVEILGPWTVNLHVKDIAVRRADHNMGFVIEGRPTGKGQLRIPKVIERLSEMGRDPNAILELWTPPAETLAQTVAKEAEWAATSVTYLRRFIPG